MAETANLRWIARALWWLWGGLSAIWAAGFGALSLWFARPDMRDGDWSFVLPTLVGMALPPLVILLMVWAPAKLLGDALRPSARTAAESLVPAPGDVTAALTAPASARAPKSALFWLGSALMFAGCLGFAHYWLCRTRLSWSCPAAYSNIDALVGHVWTPMQQHAAGLLFLMPGFLLFLIHGLRARIRQHHDETRRSWPVSKR